MAKLPVRVLENNEVLRIGSNEAIRVNVRVLAATHRDLEAAQKEGKFREDLYHRLNRLRIKLPPLRATQGYPAAGRPLARKVQRAEQKTRPRDRRAGSPADGFP